jgi:membrane peptidoglycan carboxypeptidase
MAYNSKDERFERETGPGTKDWTYLPDVGRDVPTAVIAMEDPGYPSHRGYIGQAFENSLRDNLATGKFLRGGSTITMQLAKNIWLYRDKTVTRKLQEVLFAIALENCYSKSEILELYLNVVEFGPDLYGIGPAARHYFKTSAAEITAEQSFSLAMLLPKPRKGLPDKVRVRKLMETLARLKVIPESMLEIDEPADFSDWE